MRKDSAWAALMRTKGYFRKNWGASFISRFMLLMVAASSFAIDLELLAKVANYTYYVLVAGVALQLASFLKYGERGRDKSQ